MSAANGSAAVNDQAGPPKPLSVPVSAAPQKTTLDLSGIIVGASAEHKRFGDGVVVEIANGMITAAFGTAGKKFMFPGAFEMGFLRGTQDTEGQKYKTPH